MGQRQLFTSAVIPSSFGREQSSSRGSFFIGDNFVRFMGDTFARGGSFHTFRLIRLDQFEYAILNRGPHHRGDRLFRDTSSDDTYRCMHTCIGYFRPTANWNLESPEFLHECWKKCKVVHSSPQAVVGACSCMGLRL